MKILNSKFKTNLTESSMEFYPSLNEVQNSSLFNIYKKKDCLLYYQRENQNEIVLVDVDVFFVEPRKQKDDKLTCVI